jgi:pyruvate,orthophosphate dikinase
VSFGSDRLTYCCFGFGPGDVGMFVPTYIQDHIFSADPIVTLDQHGVGPLVYSALKDCRKSNTSIFAGVFGSHAADPASVHYLNSIGMDFVSDTIISSSKLLAYCNLA